jgi:uncharacterized protein (TIGR00661 family)
MNQPVAEKNLRKLRILVAPLDWGLGHATRCIPIIEELLKLGCEPWVAAERAQHSLLKLEFPDLNFLHLDGYRVRYSMSGPGMMFAMLYQSRKILKAIKKENQWLRGMIDVHEFDGIISDNRFGLYHDRIPSVFITHQLGIKSPLGKWSERIIQNRNYSLIEKFSECWVPDYEKSPGLAGELSHPSRLPKTPLKYIGPLSRFKMLDGEEDQILILLSGPEPQRSLLENVIVSEIAHYPGKATVVRGIPGSDKLIPSTNFINFYNHLSTAELNREMAKASLIISRSGYSTIMDVLALKKKAVFVPTPGQTEQLYLSEILENSGQAPSIAQREFSLKQALAIADKFNYLAPTLDPTDNFRGIISAFINSLTKS